MATIKQVAERARVSVATVSRVLNATGFVSPDLRERVESAMHDLDYRPNGLARSLRLQRSNTIGLVIPQINHPFFSTLAFAIEAYLYEHDYRCLICNSEENPRKEDGYLRELQSQNVDGIIIIPTGQGEDGVKRLLNNELPTVLLDRDVPNLKIDRVLCDNEQGAYEVTQYLLNLGHRRIGVIATPSHSPVIAERLAGVERAFNDAGVDHAPDLVANGSLEQFGMGYTSARSMLSQASAPTAIIALTDVIAVGVLHAAAELGVAVPDDLSVTGFDDIPLATYAVPELTTVAQPLHDLGEQAARMLLDRIERPSTMTRAVTLGADLVIRKSTAAPREETA